jgi:hypothetical protein
MKVKAWHIGCLVVLVLAALYFLVGTREGLDNSTTCWADPVDGGLQDPVTNETKFVSSDAYSSYMGRNMSNLSNIQACYGGSPPSPGTPPTSSQIECVQKASGTYTSLDEAKAACSADSTCTAIISRESGDGSRPTVYSKFYEDATIVPTGGARYLGQKIYVKKPCAGSSSSASSSPSSGMGSTAPMPPGPTGTAGGASMTPAVPAPTQSAASYPAYNLTCRASPVSGMVGSVGMPETPAAWNVSQPPSGWNSKNGYTTTGN